MYRLNKYKGKFQFVRCKTFFFTFILFRKSSETFHCFSCYFQYMNVILPGNLIYDITLILFSLSQNHFKLIFIRLIVKRKSNRYRFANGVELQNIRSMKLGYSVTDDYTELKYSHLCFHYFDKLFFIQLPMYVLYLCR